jgi:hypothetical protein
VSRACVIGLLRSKAAAAAKSFDERPDALRLRSEVGEIEEMARLCLEFEMIEALPRSSALPWLYVVALACVLSFLLGGLSVSVLGGF